jgi:thioredoxin 1
MAGKHVKEAADKTFEAEVLQSSTPTLVDFWAVWCAPCRAIAPFVDQIAENYHGKLNVFKMDIDKHPQTAEKYGVRSIPTLLIFHGGKVIGNVVGAVSKAKLEDIVKTSLAKAGPQHSAS